MKKHFWQFLMMLVMLALMIGCAAVEQATTVATVVGEATGTISRQQGESIRKSSRAVSKSLEDFTPEQEYYIGRTVGAIVLTKYRPLNDDGAKTYLNTM
jgi:hypothetical protein